QTAQPLICAARRLVNSIVFRGTPPSSTDFEIDRRTSIAEGRIIAGFFILAFILLSSIKVSGSLRLHTGPHANSFCCLGVWLLSRTINSERDRHRCVDLLSNGSWVLQLQTSP